MSIAKIKLDESTNLEFGVSITGADSKPKARLVIEGTDFSVSYPCSPIQEGIQVEIGQLSGILPAGEYPVRLEVVIENKIFVPFEDTIILEPNVHVHTRPREPQRVEESVSVQGVKVSKGQNEARNRQVKLAKLIAETVGYEIQKGQTPEQIIVESIKQSKTLTESKQVLLKDMVQAAKEAGIKSIK